MTSKAKTADFSISDILAFARTKPADEEYPYWCNNCALGQFLAEHGDHNRRGEWWDDAAQRIAGVEADDLKIALGGFPETFGGLVTRLEALAEPLSDTWTRADAYVVDAEQVSV